MCTTAHGGPNVSGRLHGLLMLAPTSSLQLATCSLLTSFRQAKTCTDSGVLRPTCDRQIIWSQQQRFVYARSHLLRTITCPLLTQFRQAKASETPTDAHQNLPKKRQELQHIHEQQELHHTLISGCRSISKFQKLNKIVEGTYGIVFRAMCLDTSRTFALKKVKECFDRMCMFWLVYLWRSTLVTTWLEAVMMAGENKVRLFRLHNYRFEENKCVAITSARKHN